MPTESEPVVVIEGDCLDVLPTLADGSVDAVVTDIPYGEVNRESGGLRNLDKGIADMVTVPLDFIVRHASRLADSVYVFCGTEQVSQLRAGFVSAEMTTRLCVWEKSDPSPMNGERFWLSSIEACIFARHSKAYFGEHCASAVWRGPIEREPQHPTQKPRWLIKRLVKASAPIDGLILDPFAGSGTTGVAAIATGRRAILIERDPRYADIARRRIAESMGRGKGSLFTGVV